MFLITKKSIKKNKNSLISVGSSATSDKLLTLDKKNNLVEIIISDIKVDCSLLIFTNYSNFIKTSPITDIISQSIDFIEFKTETSTYILEYIEKKEVA